MYINRHYDAIIQSENISKVVRNKEDRNLKNVDMKLEGNILTIKVDLTKEFGLSSSGKTIIIASTEGNQSIPGREDAKIGLNVYKKK